MLLLSIDGGYFPSSAVSVSVLGTKKEKKEKKKKVEKIKNRAKNACPLFLLFTLFALWALLQHTTLEKCPIGKKKRVKTIEEKVYTPAALTTRTNSGGDTAARDDRRRTKGSTGDGCAETVI